MSQETTLLWHDYETWGVNPRVDRPAQFAAIRTNLDLEPIGEPIEFFCRPSDDFIPHPQSVLITRQTPQSIAEKGISEATFFEKIHQEFSVPGTCGVGYNSLRFDDEVTRFGFYRNFIDPFGREWQNGNSRWDIIDLVRMAYALRPEGIVWPEKEPGVPSFRLEDLTVANGISHGNAHDALADVHATIEMARCIKRAQPKLYEYYFSCRRKEQPGKLLNLHKREVVLHISGMYPSVDGCIAPVLPITRHPKNKNEIIVFNLKNNPNDLIERGAAKLAKLLFTAKDQLPEGVERPALKGVHTNRSPAVAPMNTLSPQQAKKWGFDLMQIKRHRDQIVSNPALIKKIQKVYELASQNAPQTMQDPDHALYGQFVSRDDRKVADHFLSLAATERVGNKPPFQDPRLQAIYPRYLARNWPEQLSDEQKNDWRSFCKSKLVDGDHGANFTFKDYQQAITEIQETQELNEADHALLSSLAEWVDKLQTKLS